MAESKKSISKKKKDADSIEESIASSASTIVEDADEDQIGRGVGTAQITVNRDEYLLAYRDLVNEAKHLQMKNNILHRRLAEYYKKRKCEHVLKPFEGAADLEEKYVQKLFAYEELKETSEKETADLRAKITIVENQFMGQHEHAENKFTALQTFERSTGTGLIFSAKGKSIPDKTVSRFLSLQKSKWLQASALCLRHIRARNAVAELEAIVKKLEILGPGLYVYQFEQLNVDNQNYNAKIEVFSVYMPTDSRDNLPEFTECLSEMNAVVESSDCSVVFMLGDYNAHPERHDELVKNRSKCTEHNQMLAHIREKMHHTDEVIDTTECDLGEAELEFMRAREDLGTIKTRRNKLRTLLEVEKFRAGLLTRKDLLRDFQDASDGVVVLRQKKADLEAQIANICKKLREVRKTENL